MNAAIILLITAACALLTISSFMQLLYLESMRLRTRDLPSIRYFRDSLEERLGMKTERGANSFSIIKHSTMMALGVLFCVWFNGGQQWLWGSVAEIFGSAWLSMVLCAYVLPQLLYRRTTASWVARLAPVLRAMALLVTPFVGMLSFFQSLVELADQDNHGDESEPSAAENIEALISAGREGGLIEEEDRKLIQSVVEFGDKQVREVMTARPNIVAIAADATLEQLRELAINEQYSRIPAYEKDIDSIVGFVHVRDMFELDEEERPRRTVRELMRPIRLVPETKPVNDLMREMQQESTHMVIVVDEYGNTAGLASMEDLVEVILGEIRDEHEPHSDVAEDGHGGFIVSGSFDVARLNDLFTFRPEDDIESTTVGGLVSEWLGRVPRAGEAVERDGIRVEILAGDERHVEQVRLSKSQTVAHE